MDIKQRIVNDVFKALYIQGKQSLLETGEGIMRCMYRQDETASCPIRCGIGHLIKDEYYSTDYENGTASCSSVRDALRLSGYEVSGLEGEFLREVQLALHDRLGRVSGRAFRGQLQKAVVQLCRAYNLTVPPIPEVSE